MIYFYNFLSCIITITLLLLFALNNFLLLFINNLLFFKLLFTFLQILQKLFKPFIISYLIVAVFIIFQFL